MAHVLNNRDDVVVITASNSWSDKRMADHQLAAALSTRVRVVFVDPSGFRRPTIDEDDVQVIVIRPIRLPFVRLALMTLLSRRLIAWQIRRVLRRLEATRVVLLEGNVLYPVSGLIGEDATVYWAQDDWQGLAPMMGLDPAVLARNEQMVLGRSRSVVAANPLVAERLKDRHDKVSLIPFGASTELFAGAVGEAAGDDHPVVLMGTLNSRIDYGILDSIVRSGVPLLIAGQIDTAEARDALTALQGAGRVEYLGAVDFDQLPPVLARCSAGIVPYTHSQFNRGSFPLKTVEYLAAGLPVVATDLPAIRWLDCDDVRIEDDPAAFADVTRDLWQQGRPAVADRMRRTGFARDHDWSERAAQFFDVLDEAGLASRERALR